MKQVLIFFAFFSIVSNAQNKIPIKKIYKTDKEVLFIPMGHVNSAQRYSNLKSKIAELQHKGYVVFFEGLHFEKKNDSLNHISELKLRKLMGFNLFSARTRIANNSTKIVEQPNMKGFTEVDTLSKLVDVSYQMLISKFENDNGEVKLDICDFSIPLEDIGYMGKCEKFNYPRGKFKKKYVIQFRDQYLAERISKESNNKIVVVYGADHGKGLYQQLKKIDRNWKVEKVDL